MILQTCFPSKLHWQCKSTAGISRPIQAAQRDIYRALLTRKIKRQKRLKWRIEMLWAQVAPIKRKVFFSNPRSRFYPRPYLKNVNGSNVTFSMHCCYPEFHSVNVWVRIQKMCDITDLLECFLFYVEVWNCRSERRGLEKFRKSFLDTRCFQILTMESEISRLSTSRALRENNVKQQADSNHSHIARTNAHISAWWTLPDFVLKRQPFFDAKIWEKKNIWQRVFGHYRCSNVLKRSGRKYDLTSLSTVNSCCFWSQVHQGCVDDRQNVCTFVFSLRRRWYRMAVKPINASNSKCIVEMTIG